jgi:hypothetical protein
MRVHIAMHCGKDSAQGLVLFAVVFQRDDLLHAGVGEQGAVARTKALRIAEDKPPRASEWTTGQPLAWASEYAVKAEPMLESTGSKPAVGNCGDVVMVTS